MNLISNANAKVHLFFGNHPEVYDIFKKIKLVFYYAMTTFCSSDFVLHQFPYTCVVIGAKQV